MTRLPLAAILVPATMLSSGAALADETAWPVGIASIGISYATPIVNISVENLSVSTVPDARQLAVVSSPPQFDLEGQVFCKDILGGSTRLVESQLMFGTAVVMYVEDGTDIVTIGVWDESDPIVYGGNLSAADVDLEHSLSLPETWNGGIELGFNPVKVVEDRLATYVDNGGSAADFLRQDDVFEVDIAVNLVGRCENTSDYGVYSYAGYTRRWVTAAIFYQGDPDIEDPVTIMETPDAIDGSPYLPAEFHVNAPFEGDDGDEGRFLSFDRFSVYDVDSASYRGRWTGWVTYDDGVCEDESQRAVTPTGECVLVESCVPVEFAACDTLDGCCDESRATEDTGATDATGATGDTSATDDTGATR